jgi:lipoprotein-releasing system permease protein
MFWLALRHLTSKRKQTLLTLMGVLLGSAAYVVISGIMLGFQSFLTDQLVNNDAHVKISARDEPVLKEIVHGELFDESQMIKWIIEPGGRRDTSFIEYPYGWFERLNQDVEVMAYSPQLVVQAISKLAQVAVGMRLIGCEPEKQVHVTTLSKNMTAGDFKDIGSAGNRLIMGEGLAQRLGAHVGSVVLLTAGRGNLQPFRVVGTFNVGIKAVDDSTAYGALADVQRLNQTPSRISTIAVRLNDVRNAAAVSEKWGLLSLEKVESWEQANEGMLSVFKTQDIVRNSMTFSILIVAGFGIYNILSMAVTHKMKEIAILRSMGFEPSDVVRLFFSQGLILGIIGGAVGLLIGYVACRYLESIPVSPQRSMGGSTGMLVSYSIYIYIKALVIAIGSSVVASWLPARAAGKLTPIDIIRSEAS